MYLPLKHQAAMSTPIEQPMDLAGGWANERNVGNATRCVPETAVQDQLTTVNSCAICDEDHPHWFELWHRDPGYPPSW